VTTDAIPERREHDARFVLIDTRLETIEVNQAAHIDDYHAGMSTEQSEAFLGEHHKMREVMYRISTAIEGHPKKDLYGNVVSYEGGMKNQLDEMEERLRNGGIPAKIKLSVGQKFGLSVVLIPFGTALMYLVIEFLRMGAS